MSVLWVLISWIAVCLFWGFRWACCLHLQYDSVWFRGTLTKKLWSTPYNNTKGENSSNERRDNLKIILFLYQSINQ